jgi:Na+/H+-dicarboxylate symporter
MRAIRALFLFVIALALAWLAGWGLPGSELSAPAAVASFASLGMAIAPGARKAPTAGKSG